MISDRNIKIAINMRMTMCGLTSLSRAKYLAQISPRTKMCNLKNSMKKNVKINLIVYFCLFAAHFTPTSDRNRRIGDSIWPWIRSRICKFNLNYSRDYVRELFFMDNSRSSLIFFISLFHCILLKQLLCCWDTFLTFDLLIWALMWK